MKPACEYVSREILPGLRALVAKKIMVDHGLSQTAVAKLLNTTQPAISQYKRDLRGKISVLKDDPNLARKIDEIARNIVTGKITAKEAGREFCVICKALQQSGVIPEEYVCFRD
ncbi:MAG: hypothetical protein JW754_04980 [Candidatus Aenigmarchaeota archaeon]|nr:hypothetical protein [Candidatus Aenigmarchaeota archaeon]